MPSTELAGWANFFSAGAGCSATLAGLVMVAISVNVREIIAVSPMPARALGAIGAMALMLLLCLAALAPQSPADFAVEAAIAAGLSWALHIGVARRVITGYRAIGRPIRDGVLAVIAGQAQVWPLTIGAALLAHGDMQGLDWLAAGIA